MGRSMKRYLWNNPLVLKKQVKKVKLHKSLYGLKEYVRARAWNKTANYTFEQLGFKRRNAQMQVFILEKNNDKYTTYIFFTLMTYLLLNHRQV